MTYIVIDYIGNVTDCDGSSCRPMPDSSMDELTTLPQNGS